jgi:hypothetical protein
MQLRQAYVALMCLSLLVWSAPAASETDCRALLQDYYKANSKEAVPYTGNNMLYFLHIPRTAGRTFYSCLLRIGTPGRRRCPKAYDHLRINTELPQCYLLSSHDDFSVVEQLPPDTAVITQLRDPVQRVLSAYEFAIEVAARQLRRSKMYVKPQNKVVTDDVWPWSYLIPFFVSDIKPKVRLDSSRLCSTAVKTLPSDCTRALLLCVLPGQQQRTLSVAGEWWQQGP